MRIDTLSEHEKMIKKCGEHAKGKVCFQVIAEGNCLKKNCKLFPKVLRMIPKFKRLRELEAQGAILTTRWDFSEKAIKRRERRKKKAEKWLNELFPKLKQNLKGIFEE